MKKSRRILDNTLKSSVINIMILTIKFILTITIIHSVDDITSVTVSSINSAEVKITIYMENGYLEQ